MNDGHEGGIEMSKEEKSEMDKRAVKAERAVKLAQLDKAWSYYGKLVYKNNTIANDLHKVLAVITDLEKELSEGNNDKDNKDT